jgi:hypothetical protein
MSNLDDLHDAFNIPAPTDRVTVARSSKSPSRS